MWKIIFMTSLLVLHLTALCNAQTLDEERTAKPALISATVENPLAGKWTYRSYHNRPEVMVGQDAQLALGQIFGEGVMTVDATSNNVFRATFDMGGGYILDLEGSVRRLMDMSTLIEASGKGRQGTLTEGWQYDYIGYLTAVWPKGINQVPAIVGTVIRTNPHGNAKAGYVASFIATKQP